LPYDIEDRIVKVGGRSPRISEEDIEILIPHIAHKQLNINVVEVKALINLVKKLFTNLLTNSNYETKKITALTTKFRDAGRRSAPWQPTSSVVPGRPQDGSDGNRINRWLLEPDHKFYADEITATLVEIKYFLQALSMQNAPIIPEEYRELFTPWLLEHNINPNEYLDPIQLIEIDFEEFIDNPRIIQSGHIHPLDRGGRHQPSNTFLMLSRSNQLQGNLTVEELLNILRNIIDKHDQALEENSRLEHLIRQ